VHCLYEHASRVARTDADLGVSKLSQPHKTAPTKPFFVNHGTFLKPKRLYTVTVPAHRMCKDSSMFEFVIAVIALASASIFMAHAVEAYLT
jgi:hypothetical protein